MAAPSNTTKTYYDVLGSFELGVNSGVSPTLLPKNQLAWMINGTVRGGHATTRPPFEKQTLDFGGDDALETLVTTGYFQGAGVYRPDFGASQILAQIEGHIICFTPSGSGWAVTDVSVSGDLNVIGSTPVWMWQSEKWMIISDGTGARPIFYDGVSSRRAYSEDDIFGAVTSVAPVSPPAVGETITATLSAPYSGPYNIPVFFNGAYYQPVYVPPAPPLGYDPSKAYVIATSAACWAAPTTPSVGDQIIVKPTTIGRIAAAYPVGATGTTQLDFCPGTPITIGSTLTVAGKGSFGVGLLIGTSIRIPTTQFTSLGLAVGDSVIDSTGLSPNVILGTYLGDVSALTGVANSIQIDWNFTGPANQIAWINDTPFYLTVFPTPAPVGNTLDMVNLTDVAVGNYAPSNITAIPEIPPCRMGAYGLGRNWVCLTDGVSYFAGDIVGAASGSAAENYRDSVLRSTENLYLVGGGTFRLPSSGNIITSMTFTANLDVALGQGPLQIGTDVGFFSNNCPIDRSTWEDVTNPIQTQSLIGYGPVAQNSTIAANSDILFRSIEGLGSLIIARRNFEEQQSWGNTPISQEVIRALENDEVSLSSYGSSINFDNRWLTTCYPSVSGVGVFHQGLVALNFDLVSNLRGKAPPVYDGLWTGLNFLQGLTGNFSGTGRAFAFAFNTIDEVLELYELQRAKDGHFDNGDTRISWVLETASLFREDIKPKSELIRLLDSEIEVQDVDGLVDFEIQYKPDYYPCWTTWRSFQICADQTTTDSKPGYRTRLSLGDPTSNACEANNNRPLHVGHFFQFRINITGYCKLMGMRVQATTQPEPDFGLPVCADVTSDTIPVP